LTPTWCGLAAFVYDGAVAANTQRVKKHLARLAERDVAGEQGGIANRGLPASKPARVRIQIEDRKLGSAARTVEFLPGWDETLTAEDLDRFLGR
jgi:hypothetical protein